MSSTASTHLRETNKGTRLKTDHSCTACLAARLAVERGRFFPSAGPEAVVGGRYRHCLRGMAGGPRYFPGPAPPPYPVGFPRIYFQRSSAARSHCPRARSRRGPPERTHPCRHCQHSRPVAQRLPRSRNHAGKGWTECVKGRRVGFPGGGAWGAGQIWDWPRLPGKCRNTCPRARSQPPLATPPPLPRSSPTTPLVRSELF